MRTRRRTTIEDLRLAIDCLPRATRLAMLDAIQESQIVAGAYAHAGGICPMLAAHRRGGRTNLIAFAHAWDRFVFRGARGTRPRPATARELLVLRSNLEASLLADEAPTSDLAAAILSHRELVSHRRKRARSARRDAARPGDPNRAPELASRPGWRWTRVVRSYDEYRVAVSEAQAEPGGLERRVPGRPLSVT